MILYSQTFCAAFISIHSILKKRGWNENKKKDGGKGMFCVTSSTIVQEHVAQKQNSEIWRLGWCDGSANRSNALTELFAGSVLRRVAMAFDRFLIAENVKKNKNRIERRLFYRGTAPIPRTSYRRDTGQNRFYRTRPRGTSCTGDRAILEARKIWFLKTNENNCVLKPSWTSNTPTWVTL